MDISYLGHSSFKIKGKTATVLNDPFDPSMVGIKFPKTEADIVTVSHHHADHNQLERVEGVKKVISGPGEYEVMGVSFIGIASFHDSDKGENRGKNTIFVLEMDGLRLAHLGDLGEKLSQSQLEEIGDIDVLMIPVGGFFTIGPREASEIIQEIEPYFVIPMHYNCPDLNQSQFGKLSFLDDFLRESGLVVERLPKFNLKKEDINPGQAAKIIALERK